MGEDAHGAHGRPDRHPTAIREALPEAHRAEFDSAYLAATTRADATHHPDDLNAVTDVLEDWWRIAVLTADPDAHQRMLDTADAIRAGHPRTPYPLE